MITDRGWFFVDVMLSVCVLGHAAELCGTAFFVAGDDIKDMGIETRSLVSSPLLLADLEDPRNTTFVVAGVERDTLSFPQFDEDGFITIATEDGYSPSEVDAIVEFVDSGGTVIVLEDFGYAGSIGEAYGVRYSGYQLCSSL